MNIGTLLFVLCVGLFFYSGISIYRQYRNSSGVFFLIFTVFLLFWITSASATYEFGFSKQYLLLFNQISYWFSMCLFINLNLFFLFFGSTSEKVNKILLYTTPILFILLYIFIGTKYIVSDLRPMGELGGDYEEVYGDLFVLLQIFFSLVPLVFAIISYLTIRKQDYITKVRLTWIVVGFICTAVIAILFLIVFPLLNIYNYEGEVIYFFIPFLFGTIYSSRTYVFSSFRDIFVRIQFFLISFGFSYLGILVLRYLLMMVFPNNMVGEINKIGVFDIVMYTIIFMFVSKYFEDIFQVGKNFFTPISEIQKKIPFTTTLEDLNFLLEEDFKKQFGIGGVKVKYFPSKSSIKEDILFHYFLSAKRRKFFLNDIVFIQENVSHKNTHIFSKKIPKEVYLVFPLRKKEELVGYVTFGKKSFNGFYKREEVETLEKFVSFIEGHLKYIDIYEEIHDLNLNLEKRVDEKTMQFNAIINRQKEFIEVVSHEVRTPLATALFQSECLEDELREITFIGKRKIIGDVKSLYNKIVDTVSLVNKLFSIERFESNKITLYKENTDIAKMVKTQVQGFIKSHKEIDFQYTQETNIGYMDIDIVQFKQVIDNLVTNAIKFTSKVQHPKISIKLVKRKNDIIFTIEDSGLGFSGIDISNLFEKYNTGNSSSIGLGMGLYLCKKIVELHDGKISAGKSKSLGGALFKIIIPTLKKLKN